MILLDNHASATLQMQQGVQVAVVAYQHATYCASIANCGHSMILTMLDVPTVISGHCSLTISRTDSAQESQESGYQRHTSTIILQTAELLCLDLAATLLTGMQRQ